MALNNIIACKLRENELSYLSFFDISGPGMDCRHTKQAKKHIPGMP